MNKQLITAAMVAISAAATITAQNTTTPYSMYGYGIIGDRATSMQRQMGGVGYAMNSGRQINVMNPASYAAVDSLTFIFDLGADISFLRSKEGSAKEHSIGGGVDYVTMQFPIAKWLGGSVGMLPYSSVGYAFGNEIRHGTMENQGSGGINQLYLGFGGKVGGFSLGFNVSYDFGNIVNDVFSKPSGSGQSKFEHVMEVRDWNINIGAQYTQRFNRWNKLVLGVTYSPKKTLLGKTWVTAQETSQEALPDTISFSRLKNKYYMPNTVGAGLSYTYERNFRLEVEADMTWQQWSKAAYSPLYSNDPKHTDVVVFEGEKFYDRVKYAVGAAYQHRVRGSYLQRITYRLGAYYCDDYLNINGNRLKEYGVTCGFGLPTYEGKTLINLGFEWKRRAAAPQELIRENYFNITLGVNFNEVWFWKRKIK